MGFYCKLIDCFFVVFKQLEVVGDIYGIVGMVFGIVSVYDDQENYLMVFIYFKKLLEGYCFIFNFSFCELVEEVIILYNIGYIYVNMGDYELVKSYYF